MVKDIKVCPNCGNKNIEYASLQRRSGAIIGLGVPGQYYCPRCKYIGSVILSVPEDRLKKMIFKPKIITRKQPEKVAEIFEPVFMGVIIIFIILAVFMLIPRYTILDETQVTALGEEGIGSVEDFIYIPPAMQLGEGDEQPFYGTYWIIRNATISDVDRAIGHSNTIGFLTPVFFLFFILGFIIVMIYSHWHRVKFFTR